MTNEQEIRAKALELAIAYTHTAVLAADLAFSNEGSFEDPGLETGPTIPFAGIEWTKRIAEDFVGYITSEPHTGQPLRR
jgi:hypothetical protein